MSTSHSAPLYYEMKVQELLDANRLGWFEGMEVRHEGGTTTVSGVVEDAAALYGVIGRARDLGLTLISVVSEQRCSGCSGPGATPTRPIVRRRRHTEDSGETIKATYNKARSPSASS